MKPYLVWTLLPVLLLTLVLLPLNGADAQPQLFSPNPTASEMIEKVNALRESNGLDPYEANTVLMTVAQTHANYIASTGVLTHFDDKGNRPYQRAINSGYAVAGNLSFGGLFSEAIYSGSGLSDDDVLAAWQANSADSITLLSEDYKDIGIGIAAANGLTYYVLDVGTASESGLASITEVGTKLPVGTGAPNTPLPSGEIYHVVQKDEALWSIAVAYGTTIAELKILNNLASDEIFEGQRLLVRRANTETPSPSPVPVTATLGIPTSTATLPVTPTITLTPTPLPVPPATLQSGGMVVGGIVLVALLAAGLVAFLGRRKKMPTD